MTSYLGYQHHTGFAPRSLECFFLAGIPGNIDPIADARHHTWAHDRRRILDRVHGRSNLITGGSALECRKKVAKHVVDLRRDLPPVARPCPQRSAGDVDPIRGPGYSALGDWDSRVGERYASDKDGEVGKVWGVGAREIERTRRQRNGEFGSYLQEKQCFWKRDFTVFAAFIARNRELSSWVWYSAGRLVDTPWRRRTLSVGPNILTPCILTYTLGATVEQTCHEIGYSPITSLVPGGPSPDRSQRFIAASSGSAFDVTLDTIPLSSPAFATTVASGTVSFTASNISQRIYAATADAVAAYDRPTTPPWTPVWSVAHTGAMVMDIDEARGWVWVCTGMAAHAPGGWVSGSLIAVQVATGSPVNWTLNGSIPCGDGSVLFDHVNGTLLAAAPSNMTLYNVSRDAAPVVAPARTQVFATPVPNSLVRPARVGELVLLGTAAGSLAPPALAPAPPSDLAPIPSPTEPPTPLPISSATETAASDVSSSSGISTVGVVFAVIGPLLFLTALGLLFFMSRRPKTRAPPAVDEIDVEGSFHTADMEPEASMDDRSERSIAPREPPAPIASIVSMATAESRPESFHTSLYVGSQQSGPAHIGENSPAPSSPSTPLSPFETALLPPLTQTKLESPPPTSSPHLPPPRPETPTPSFQETPYGSIPSSRGYLAESDTSTLRRSNSVSTISTVPTLLKRSLPVTSPSFAPSPLLDDTASTDYATADESFSATDAYVTGEEASIMGSSFASGGSYRDARERWDDDEREESEEEDVDIPVLDDRMFPFDR
ncbi:hypothetical protein BDK51DRAFT_40450 [Blyttiomyces helicus]|uniref:Uncharacterized protein n=1 Tax=Blyttiomyces helicus TaxID=388810 RepID=A0A4V1IQW3_9FUNG|nr:hypothetical protein BDK51DRAFT_40450 [Blyttiomyces helicus]|eukprot:RKO87957.1 hypothetical protein BDK51DRAFT_40450 [Blyttiomyces helicus]